MIFTLATRQTSFYEYAKRTYAEDEMFCFMPIKTLHLDEVDAARREEVIATPQLAESSQFMNIILT